MSYFSKILTIEDLPQAIEVEALSTPSLIYLKQAWPTFSNSDGALVGIYEDHQLLGIGRITIMADNNGWLETLRVKPESQNKGVGKEIYKQWLKIAKEKNVKSLSMYTGEKNVRSSHLAELFGLTTDQKYHCYNLTELAGGNTGNFVHVSDYDEAVNEIMKYQNQYRNRLSINNTYYKFSEENIRQFIMEGKVFVDKESNSYIIIGCRFQYEKAMHLAFMSGDFNKCIDFAVNYTKANGNNKLSCTVALENEIIIKALENRGFECNGATIITKSINL